MVYPRAASVNELVVSLSHCGLTIIVYTQSDPMPQDNTEQDCKACLSFGHGSALQYTHCVKPSRQAGTRTLQDNVSLDICMSLANLTYNCQLSI